jgi:hypothetical protein
MAIGYNQENGKALKSYEIGFQLIDRSDDGKRAFGLTIYKIGSGKESILLGAPIIYVGGKIKGTDVLILKESDLIIPYDKDWIKYILQKGSTGFGRPTDRDIGKKGIKQPDLSVLHRGFNKNSSATDAELKDLFIHVVNIMTGKSLSDPKYNNIKSLKQAVETLGPGAARVLYDMAESSPTLGNFIREEIGRPSELQFKKRSYADFNELLKKLNPDAKKPVVLQTSRLTIVTYQKGKSLPLGLDDDKLKELRGSKGEVIVDKRTGDEVSKISYQNRRLCNPTKTGMYDILLEKNKFEKMLVIVSPFNESHKISTGRQPNSDPLGFGSSEFRGNRVIAVRKADGNFEAFSARSNFLWGRPLDDCEYCSFVSKNAIPASDIDSGRYILLHGEKPYGSSVLSIEKISVLGKSSKRKYNAVLQVNSDGPSSGILEFNSYGGDRVIQDDGNIYLGSEIKAIEVDINYELGDYFRDKKFQWDEMDITPGYEQITGTFSGGSRITLNDQKFDKKSAVKHLVFEHGLREGDAIDYLSKVVVGMGDPVVAFIKKSEIRQPVPYSMPDYTYGMEDTTFQTKYKEYPAKVPIEEYHDMDYGGPKAEDVINPRWDTDVDSGSRALVTKAVASGSKDVAEFGTIIGLIQSKNIDRYTEDILPDLFLSMDRFGKTLILLWYHRDAFIEKFGRDNVNQMEDLLSESHGNAGKLILEILNTDIREQDSDMQDSNKEVS